MRGIFSSCHFKRSAKGEGKLVRNEQGGLGKRSRRCFQNQRHAALGAITGMVLQHFGVRRARVKSFRSRSPRRVALQRFSRLCPKIFPTLFATKIKRLSIALSAERPCFIHHHSANGICSHKEGIWLRCRKLGLLRKPRPDPVLHLLNSCLLIFDDFLGKFEQFGTGLFSLIQFHIVSFH